MILNRDTTSRPRPGDLADPRRPEEKEMAVEAEVARTLAYNVGLREAELAATAERDAGRPAPQFISARHAPGGVAITPKNPAAPVKAKRATAKRSTAKKATAKKATAKKG